MSDTRSSKPPTDAVKESDLANWKLLRQFRERLAQIRAQLGVHPSFSDPKRLLAMGDYLSLFLFGLVNPALRTMRALCWASDLDRVRQEAARYDISVEKMRKELEEQLDRYAAEHDGLSLTIPMAYVEAQAR